MTKESRQMTRDELQKLRIGVLLGGFSAEREVSLRSGKAIYKALVGLGLDVVAIDVDHDIVAKLEKEKIQAAFIALHGRYGEDGAIQGLLETIGIPYTGSGVLSSALGMDKMYSKQIFRFNNLPLVEYLAVDKYLAVDMDLIGEGLGFPLVVKPRNEGSSIGVSIVKEEVELSAALKAAWKYDRYALLERYVKGREIQVGILNDEVLGTIEIVPAGEFYDYTAKYTDGGAKHLVPAPISAKQEQEVKFLALKAHRALGCAGATRVDFLLNEAGGFYLLEVNTLPGMTEVSLLPEIAVHAGLSFSDLVYQIMAGAELKLKP